MTLKDLKSVLTENKMIPEDSYALDGGLPNEALCISMQEEDWVIYYSERGKKTNVAYFNNESEACDYFYNRLLHMIGLN